MRRYSVALGTLLLCGLIAPGCGDREEGWETPPSVTHVVPLTGSFAVVDNALHRVSLVSAGSDLSLTAHHQPTGSSVLTAKASPKGDRLYVLAQGTRPHLKPGEDVPALWVYDGTGSGAALGTYTLDEPLNDLTIDPEGQFVVVHPSGKGSSFLANPNELVIIDVTKPAGNGNPVMRTLRSFGGTPQRLTFTKKLALPAGERRLLIVETDQEVSLLDLNNLDRAEITVQLNSADGTTKAQPQEVLVDEGEENNNNDTRIAVRTSEAGVVILTLAPLSASKVGKVPNDFEVVFNVLGVNGPPSDIAFVRTDAGRRLAVLEPSGSRATLIDLDTTVPTTVDLPAPYGSLAVVTDNTGTSGTQSDVALLWGGYSSASGVAFWSLGKSIDEPYRSIEVLSGVASNVAQVIAVPAPNDALKVLVPPSLSSGYAAGEFYVLDLHKRTASPLFTSAGELAMTVSADGQRAWFFQQRTTKLAWVDLTTLHPVNLYLDENASYIFDIQAQGGNRAMIALHPIGNYGATVFDAVHPNDASSARYVGLLQGGF